MTPQRHPDLVVGRDDDALVWRRPNGAALIASVDVFTPIVDDARTWGAIAAVNAASDVYAMGGRPIFALAIAAWPRDQLPLATLSEVLAGGEAAAAEGGWVVAGGHTIDGTEPLYGQVVIGEVDDLDDLVTNAGARAGDVLVLTKPLGTGLVATAHKRRPAEAVAPGGDLHELYDAAVRHMLTRNDVAAAAARQAGVTAMTDVTGFGLLGHLHEMTSRSGVGASLDADAVPLLAGVTALVDAGDVPGGTRRNLADVRAHLRVGDAVDDAALLLLADAQTSGGLLAAVPASAADAMVATVGGQAAVVGRMVEGPAGSIEVRRR